MPSFGRGGLARGGRQSVGCDLDQVWTTTGHNYYPVGHADGTSAESVGGWLCPRGGQVSRFRMRVLSNALTGGEGCTFTLQLNEADSALLLTISAGDGAGATLEDADVLAVAAGDRLRIRGASTVVAGRRVEATFAFEFTG